MASIIQSTVSGWHTHVVVQIEDKGKYHYLGKVNSYNNKFTQIFSKMLGISKEVLIGEKIRTVHKRSYAKLLKKIGIKEKIIEEESTPPHNKDWPSPMRPSSANAKKEAIKEMIRAYKDFSDAVKEAKKIDSKKLATEKSITPWLSKGKQKRLFIKLREAISGKDRDSAQAIKMIAKGASLDQVYYDRGEKYGMACKLTEDLPDKTESISVVEGSPLIHAQEKNMDTVVKVLLAAGAKTEYKDKKLSGSRFTLNRKILDVSQKLAWGFSYPKITFSWLKFTPKFGFGMKKELCVNIDNTRENEEVIKFASHSV